MHGREGAGCCARGEGAAGFGEGDRNGEGGGEGRGDRWAVGVIWKGKGRGSECCGVLVRGLGSRHRRGCRGGE